MAAITSAVVAVVGAGVAIKGQMDAKKAQQKAAKDSESANIQSAKQLAEASGLAEQDILRANELAATRSALGATEAEQSISPFLQPGEQAFAQAKTNILGGGPIGGPLADSIRQASLGANVGAFEGSQSLLDRNALLSVSGVTPAFNQSLLSAGEGGILAAGDIGGIRQRGFESLADIAQATGSQRASLLVGQAPGLQTLSQGAGEARLLGNVAGQRANTATAETLAKLAGRLV